jgi:hypothetical protein
MAKFRVIPHSVDAEYDEERNVWSVSRPDGFCEDVDVFLFRQRYTPGYAFGRDMFLEVYGDASWGFAWERKPEQPPADQASSLVDKTG